MQIVEIQTDHKAESPFANRIGEQPVRLTFYLDGAHTEESMATCGTWFADTVAASGAPDSSSGPGSTTTETQRVLLFNCMQVCTSRSAYLGAHPTQRLLPSGVPAAYCRGCKKVLQWQALTVWQISK